MHITILGDVISKKNSKQIVRMGRRISLIPSKAYAAWHKQAMNQLEGTVPYSGTYPITVEITLYPKTKRRQDLTNRAESVMDTLVDAVIIADDDITHINKLTLLFGGYDKENPRVEIAIT